MRTVGDEQPLVRIRPRRALIGIGYLSLFVALVPINLALIFGMHNRNNLVVAFSTDGILIVVAVALTIRQLAVRVEATPTVLRGNGIFSPMIAVARRDVFAVHRVTLTRQGREPAPQTVVVDHDGHAVFRMRDYFWHRRDLDRLTRVLDPAACNTVLVLDDAELAERFPGAHFWFENNSFVTTMAALAVAALTLLGVTLFLALDR